MELLANLKFKSILPVLEPVAATYAMGISLGCVIDLGHTQTTVQCVEEGVVLPNSIIKKRFGGKDISELLYRLLMSEQALHYFPKDVLWPNEYPYHEYLMERVKENYCSLSMNPEHK